MMSTACPGSLLKASFPVMIDGKRFIAVIDSGSSENYLSSWASATLTLDIYSSSHEVQKASSLVKSEIRCLADVTAKRRDVHVNKVEWFWHSLLHAILRLNFQCHRQRLIFIFDGTAADLLVSNVNSCAFTATLEALLFLGGAFVYESIP